MDRIQRNPNSNQTKRTEVIAVDARTEILFKDEVVKENESLKLMLAEQRTLTEMAQSKLELVDSDLK